MDAKGYTILAEGIEMLATGTSYTGQSAGRSDCPVYNPATFYDTSVSRRSGGFRVLEGGGAVPILFLEPVCPVRTTSNLIDTYLASLSGKAYRDARSMLNKWARPAIGHIPLPELSPLDIEQLHASIPPKRTANSTVDYLHAALRRAERWGWIPRGTNPAAYRGEYRHRERPRTRILTADERSRMWEWLRAEESSGVGFRALRSQAIQILALTGLRKGEIIGLPWDEVELSAQIPTAYIEHTKPGDPKTAYLSPAAVALLRRIDTEGNVFPWLTTHPMDLAWSELREACGLEGVVLHDVRRTYWSLVGDAGVPVEDACATSGHASMKVHVRHYRHVSEKRKSEIAGIGSRMMSN